MAGLSVGSTGPGAAVDGYVDLGLGLYGRASVVWLGAMHAWGADGPATTASSSSSACPAAAAIPPP